MLGIIIAVFVVGIVLAILDWHFIKPEGDDVVFIDGWRKVGEPLTQKKKEYPDGGGPF